MKAELKKVGNSQGLIIPKAMIDHFKFHGRVNLVPTDNGLLIKSLPTREGWADASKQIALAGDDQLVMGEFANDGDKDLEW